MGDVLGDTIIASGFSHSKIKYLRDFGGGPRRIRTPDPLIRSQVLYPAELSVREREEIDVVGLLCKG